MLRCLESWGVACVNPLRTVEVCGDKVATHLALALAGVARGQEIQVLDLGRLGHVLHGGLAQQQVAAGRLPGRTAHRAVDPEAGAEVVAKAQLGVEEGPVHRPEVLVTLVLEAGVAHLGVGPDLGPVQVPGPGFVQEILGYQGAHRADVQRGVRDVEVRLLEPRRRVDGQLLVWTPVLELKDLLPIQVPRRPYAAGTQDAAIPIDDDVGM